MRSELQFFMHPDDEKEFEKRLETISGLVIERGSSFDRLVVGGVWIQYQRSTFDGNVLVAGRIAIATTGLVGEELSADPAPAERR